MKTKTALMTALKNASLGNAFRPHDDIKTLFVELVPGYDPHEALHQLWKLGIEVLGNVITKYGHEIVIAA